MEEAMMGKKKWWSLPVCLLFCFMLCGCTKVTIAPAVPLQEVWTEHRTEEYVYAYTLDETGNLYTLEVDLTAQEESGDLIQDVFAQLTLEEIMQLTPEELDRMEQKKECFFLRKYNVKGEREYSKALDDDLNSCIATMAVKDGLVYFVPYTFVEDEPCAVLYSYCPETEELTKMKELPYFKWVNRIIPMGDCIYLLGKNVEGHGTGDSRKYEYTGEKIFCYTVSEDKLVELGIEEPMDICVAEEGKLGIYAHMGDEFCLLSYDTSRDAMKVLAKTKEYKTANVAFCSERQAVIYGTVARGLVLSSFSDLEVESEIYPNGFFWDNNLCYVNGNVACKVDAGRIIQFPLEAVKCDNKILRYITAHMPFNDPFGCGYEIQKNILSEDKFALKVMALDKDFDVCFVNSRDSFSYNLRENGVFYPLNEIEGIQEYLDACFPYVREAATDRDGNIWMLPVAVDIRGFLVYKEAMEDTILKKDMTYEEYGLAYEALSEEEKKWAEPPSSFAEQFVVRYILDNGTIDTEEFRNVLQGMASRSSVQTEKTNDSYVRVFEESSYRAYYRTYVKLHQGTEAVVYAEPKLTATDKNAGYCCFLAVNPYSDNLEETLQYIATLVAYMQEREDAPLFFENRKVEDTLFDRSLYELYQNGEILFSVEDDVYAEYYDVMDGTLSVEEFIKEAETKVKIFLNE